jgi:hypothetical protein
MDTVLTILDMLSRLGRIVVELIRSDPNAAQLKAEALSRLADLQALLANDPVAEDLRKQLDAAVPPG